jgi:arginyl-tRNA synthetase
VFDEGISSIKDNRAVVLEKEGKNAGCLVVKLSEEFEKEFGKMENPEKILIRSDGTAVYTGKDVIFHLWKFGKLKSAFSYEPFIKQPNGKTAYKTSARGKPMDFGKAHAVINVIGVEQKYPQRVIVEVLKSMGFREEGQRLRHLSNEQVGLPDEKFSGRKGNWIGYTADGLLEEAQRRVLEKISVEMPEGGKRKVATAVGIGAIKFSFLRASSDKRITFRWESALSMEGDSGPYLQYAYVRTNGIIAKATEKESVEEVSFNPSERQLIKRMAQFRDVVERGAKELAPHHMAQYSLDLASDFSGFYTNSPVLVAEDGRIRKTRLAITKATGIMLKNALWLLGIECPERM